MRAELAIELHRCADGSARARGTLALPPYWCRWDGDTLWIAGSAATPVGEDDLVFELRVGEGVRATVRSVAASIVYAGRGGGTRLTTRLHVAAGAALEWAPEPVIVTPRADHRSLLVANVDPGGSLLADELVVLGRSGEEAGRYVSALDVRRGTTPLCSTSFDTSTPGWAGPGGTGGAKVVGTRLLVAPGPSAGEGPGGPTVDRRTVVLRPEAGGALATTLAADATQARAQLDGALPTRAAPVLAAASTGG